MGEERERIEVDARVIRTVWQKLEVEKMGNFENRNTYFGNQRFECLVCGLCVAPLALKTGESPRPSPLL